jgi:hypothetical protein
VASWFAFGSGIHSSLGWGDEGKKEGRQPRSRGVRLFWAAAKRNRSRRGGIDPEAIAAVAEYPNPQRTEFESTCVKIGVLSLRAACGTTGGDVIRSGCDRLIDQLAERLSGYCTLIESNVAMRRRQ